MAVLRERKAKPAEMPKLDLLKVGPSIPVTFQSPICPRSYPRGTFQPPPTVRAAHAQSECRDDYDEDEQSPRCGDKQVPWTLQWWNDGKVLFVVYSVVATLILDHEGQVGHS